MNVFEDVLEQLGRSCCLEVDVALEFAQQREAVHHNEFVTRVTTAIVHATTMVNCRRWLERLGVLKAT